MRVECFVCKTTATDFSCRCDMGSFGNPSPEIMRSLYDQISEDDLNHPLQETSSLSAKAARDARVIRKYLSQADNRQKCLEIGPGLGDLQHALRDSVDYHAADISKNYLQSMNLPPGRRFLWDVTSGGIAEAFDVIVACDVFEHVLNEGDAWLSVARALKPGGFLYLRVPVGEPLIQYANGIGCPFPFVHLRSYSVRYLRQMAFMAQLQVLDVRRYYEPASWSRRHFGFSFLQRKHATNHVAALRAAYASKTNLGDRNPSEGSELPQDESSAGQRSFRHELLKKMPKIVADQILRGYPIVTKLMAPLTHRPIEVALVLRKP